MLILHWYLVLCYPAYILWTVNITIRKKILLSAVFGLVGFTIAITIIRGSMLNGRVQLKNALGDPQVNITWITFWLYVEFTVCRLRCCV